MQSFLRFSGPTAAALAFAAFAPGAVAQELRNHDLCVKPARTRLNNWATVMAIC